MKKMFLIIMMFVLFTINVKATTIEKIYIDAETEIAGGLKIKELVKVTNQDEPININIFYKDKSLSTKSLDGSSLKENAIYNGSGVLLSKIGVIKDPLFADEYSDASFYDSYVTPIEMKYNDTGENYIVTLNSSKKENVYYIEYTVLNVLVEHKDCAELYYRFIDNFNYNVKSITVITKLPYHSDLFKVWAHGSKNTVVSIDGKSSMVHNEITNYKLAYDYSGIIPKVQNRNALKKAINNWEIWWKLNGSTLSQERSDSVINSIDKSEKLINSELPLRFKKIMRLG